MKTRTNYRLRRTVVILLTLEMVLLSSVLRIRPAFAITGVDGMDDCGNPPSGCDECYATCPDEGMMAHGSMRPFATGAPVHFMLNSAIERTVDLALPGPILDWSHIRTYDSRLSRFKDVYDSFVDREGDRWHGGAAGPYLRFPFEDEDPDNDLDLEVYYDATSKRVFKYDDGTYIPPVDSDLTIAAGGTGATATITLANTRTGEVLIFYGLNSSIPRYHCGRLKERTTRALIAAGKAGNTYFYNVEQKVDKVMTSQGWLVDYNYSPVAPKRLYSIAVYAGPTTGSTLLQSAVYRYFVPGYDITDLGSDGDLVQVQVRRRATNDSGNEPSDLSIVRTTQYRYFGAYHQLKMVLESNAIQRAIDYSVGDMITAPDHVLAIADAGVSDFATREFTQYVDNSIPTETSWGTEGGGQSLDNKYGGGPSVSYMQFDVGTVWGGAVASESMNAYCSACTGSGSAGVKKEYYYLELADWYGVGGGPKVGKDDPNKVVRIVVEDTVDAVGAARYRRLYGVNYNGTAIRQAFLQNPLSPSASNIWCTSIKLNSDWRVTEVRMPSAHKYDATNGKGVRDNPTLKKFLNPTGNSEVNDIDTVQTTSGLVYHYEYDNAAGKRPTGVRLSQGTTGTKYYVAATDYGDGDGDNTGKDKDEGKLPVKQYLYPTKTTDRSSGIPTTIAYTFWDSLDTAIKSITGKLPKIATTQNGAGNGVSDPLTELGEYFDKEGQLRWTKDGEGNINYHSYHPDTGGLAYTMTDVETDDLPADITAGSAGKWIEWDDGSGGDTIPTGFTNTDNDNLQLVNKAEFDSQGRETLSIDPSATKHATRYFSNGMMELPYINGSGVPTLPATVSKVNNGSILLEEFAVDPSTVSTSTTSLPTNSATYISWTKYGYHNSNGQLTQVDRYHNIAGSGGEGTGNQFFGTRYFYDELGRQSATVAYVQDGTYKFQVTLQLFDLLGRPTKRFLDVVSSAPSSYAALFSSGVPKSSFALRSEAIYDSGVVGDSHVTESRSYYDAGKYTGQVFHRTFRGHLRGIERRHHNGTTTTDETPQAAMDVDWMGRTIAAAHYTSEPTWSTLESGYDAYVNHSSGATGRNFLTETSYDDLGRVFRTKGYPGTEATNHIEVNNFYDRNDRLVATGDKYAAHMEYAYDGVGRRYQERTVLNLEATKYSSGAFDYVEPAPHPVLTSMSSTGDDGLIEFTHKVFDAIGNTIE